MAWHVYSTSYIDYGWETTKSVEETRKLLSRKSPGDDGPYGYDTLEGIEVDEFDAQFEEAKKNARRRGWEGDFRQGPNVFWLPMPDENTFVPAFVWKQDNNGTTFTVSPVPLSWLE